MKKSIKAICAAAMLSVSAIAAVADVCDEQRQIEVLALNIYHEARGDGTDGMLMVAEVTMNRVEHPLFPDDVCGVVYARRQFSWTHLRRDHTPHETEVWEEALEIAEGVINGDVDTFGTGATHFLNPAEVVSMPRWTRDFEQVGRVGGHVFYRM